MFSTSIRPILTLSIGGQKFFLISRISRRITPTFSPRAGTLIEDRRAPRLDLSYYGWQGRIYCRENSGHSRGANVEDSLAWVKAELNWSRASIDLFDLWAMKKELLVIYQMICFLSDSWLFRGSQTTQGSDPRGGGWRPAPSGRLWSSLVSQQCKPGSCSSTVGNSHHRTPLELSGVLWNSYEHCILLGYFAWGSGDPLVFKNLYVCRTRKFKSI